MSASAKGPTFDESASRLEPLLAKLDGEGIGHIVGGDHSFDFHMETKNIRLAKGTHAIPRLGA